MDCKHNNCNKLKMATSAAGTEVSGRMQPMSTNNIFMNRKMFNDPIHGTIDVHPVCVRIIDTPEFQRLRHIKQLDTCYLVYPGASHNRFEHSLGVSYLAGKLLKTIREQQPEEPITDRDILCVEIAGLCHDLGQGPFSHVFEKRFMPKMRKEFKHETMARKLFEYMLDKNNGEIKDKIQAIIGACNIPNFEEFTEDDFTFIKEMIDVPKDLEIGPWPYKGREENKSYMYEIVANKRNGIDVDKWDYLARDSYMLGVKINFDYHRCFATARVLRVNGLSGPNGESNENESTDSRRDIVPRKQICYREKEAQNLYDMFYTRMTLHKQAYQHKTHSIIGMMICDALVAANESIRLAGKSISDTVDDMQAFTQLTDDIILSILYPPTRGIASRQSETDGLTTARSILNDIFERKLYKFVSQTQVKKGELIEHEFKEHIVRSLTEDGFPIEEKFIEYDIVNLDYGMEDKDPLEKVRFYRKDQPNEALKLERHQVSYVLPETFAEQLVRIYCKVNGPDPKVENVKKAFYSWCIQKGFPPPKGGVRRQTDGD
ncbi:deoxynucleoside triphosphate triphosphohydrolase SAMHD1-like isoform X2 [Ruditapes philippinarum]|uniref:deoxynucleoside triphosphate triphosphohydrolase SAMHD1-like isoform X2 n=1 Tax=Ruditapes philippinarum TaxID=129788 RepID=UPI00295B52CE|nr:deoxynucleoside triphosphate triphosphohydrolase SAMHD1-like isoform X2 [Ruditapes philippinarum]